MDFRSATYTHDLAATVHENKTTIARGVFFGKEGKTTLLDWSIKNLLQPILPLVHKHHVTNRDSSRVAEPHYFLTSGSHYVIGDSHPTL